MVLVEKCEEITFLLYQKTMQFCIVFYAPTVSINYPGGWGRRTGVGTLIFLEDFCQKPLPWDDMLCQKT